jgi:3-dehydroquinate dehydratase II
MILICEANKSRLKIAVLNGPNLNLTGVRQKEIYGATSWHQIEEQLTNRFPDVNWVFYQSNVEGELINELHRLNNQCDGIILNAGGYTHTSIALGDAVAAIDTPVIEVHLSNILGREIFRQHSFISPFALGIISGFGAAGYELAAVHFLNHLKPTH